MQLKTFMCESCQVVHEGLQDLQLCTHTFDSWGGNDIFVQAVSWIGIADTSLVTFLAKNACILYPFFDILCEILSWRWRLHGIVCMQLKWSLDALPGRASLARLDFAMQLGR